MFKKSYPNYFKLSDSTRLFYNGNFTAETLEKYPLPLLVFNYGLVCNMAHWEKQIPFFDNLGFPMIIYDLRGHHRSEGKIDNLSFEQFATDLFELKNHLCPQKEFFVLGHSMGVNITLEFAKLYPNLLKGIVLISGTVIPPQGVMLNSNLFEIITPWWEELFNKYPKIYRRFWKKVGTNPLILKIIHRGGFNTDQVPIEYVEKYLNRMGQLDPELFFKCFSAMKEHNIISYLEFIQTPTLVMSGDKDEVIPNYTQNIIYKKLPNSEFYLIKDGSHVPQVDFPQTCNERILLFIQKQTNRKISPRKAFQ